VLDPRISYECLRDDFSDDAGLLTDFERSKDGLKFHFDLSYVPIVDTTSLSSQLEPQVMGGSPQKVDFTSRYRKKMGASSTTDKLTEYFRITSISEPFGVIDPLRWPCSRSWTTLKD
jgi:hypothetical protein